MEMDEHRNGQTTTDIESREDLDPHVQVSRALFHGIEVGKVKIVAQLQLTHGFTCTNKTLVVTDVDVATIVVLNDVFNLR
jgi:hypothetical protein